MEISGRYFSLDIIRRIHAAVETAPDISRGKLSHLVCDWLNWRAPNGKFQEVSCRKALAKLHRRGVIVLPENKQTYAFQGSSSVVKKDLPELAMFEGSLAELGEIEIVPICSRYSKVSRVWKSLMQEFHPLGDGPLCGAQMRYLIRSSKYGWLGGLSFSGATYRLQSRDKWINWSEEARRANLRLIVNNSRFLILPMIRVKNLASHVLSQTLKRLRKDWSKHYGYEPVLVESFVNGKQFSGTSYLAANWIHIGKTAGRLDAYANGKRSDGQKEIYVYSLDSKWQEVLCKEPKILLGKMFGPEEPEDWAEEEFGKVVLYDERLKSRLYTIARDFFSQPGVAVPQASNGSVAKIAGAYRFFHNKQVDMKKLLRGHTEATVGRIREKKVVLAVQDTTTLNYTAHPATDKLGPINGSEDPVIGLILHSTLAFTEDGTPLGLLDVQCWARDKEKVGKKKNQRKELPIEEKESFKWLKSYQATAEVARLCPDTMLVNVGDREADIYELFAMAEQNVTGPKLLIRAEKTRQRRTEEILLWEKMQAEPIAEYQEIVIPRKGKCASRTARLAVRYREIMLSPPKEKKLPPVRVWAVYVKEIDYGCEVTAPLEWMLLTTVSVSCLEDANKMIKWYARRWGIEVYHRILKSGCRIEDRRLGDAKSLEACLAIDFVVAWRIYFLTKQGRETPNMSCDVFLSEEEWQVLYVYVKGELPPKKPPCIRDAVRMIAALGGFLGRKSDGEPGTTTLWRGLRRLADISKGFRLCKKIYSIRDGP